MRDPKRIKPLLKAIEAIMEAQPDTRLCQLLSNAAWCAGWKQYDLFHLEDDELLKGLKKYSEDM